MLNSHRTTSHLHAGGTAPVTDSASHVAAGLSACLTLPALANSIPAKFSAAAKNADLLSLALTLADLGVMQEKHWQGDMRAAVTQAFMDLTRKHLPKPLAEYTLLVAGDAVKAELDYDDCRQYADYYKLPRKTKVSVIIVTFANDGESLVHRCIGPAIKRLEKQRKGLGQTVLYWMHESFRESARALDPINGIGAARHNYWMGEEDESSQLEEELDYLRADHAEKMKATRKKDRVPFDEKAAKEQIGMFTKADYDKAIPPEFGSAFKDRPTHSLKTIKRLLPRSLYDAVASAAALHTGEHPQDINDVGLFQKCNFEMSPYLIRWHCTRDRKNQDPLAMLYDDYMNNEMQAGEVMMDVNAVFAWHDAKTLIGAIERLETYCRRLAAAERILSLIAPNKI